MPRSFAINSDGSVLAVAGQLSNHLSVYQLDSSTGALDLTARIAMSPNPS